MLGRLTPLFSAVGSGCVIRCHQLNSRKCWSSSYIHTFNGQSAFPITRPGKQGDQGKNAKQLVIRNKIEPHDYDIKVKTILKWLSKGHEVTVVIQNVSKEKTRNENLADSLQRAIAQKGTLDKPKRNEREWKLTIHPINEETRGLVSYSSSVSPTDGSI